MALALYLVKTPYALTVNTNDLTGMFPSTMVVQPGGVFVANTTDALVSGLVAKGALASSAPGVSTPFRFETFTQTP